MEYLKDSIFDKDALQTKVKTTRITKKERFLGHILGPGMVYVLYSVILALRELYYMDVLRINEVFENSYTYMIMSVVTSIVGIATGFAINHITEKTVCRAGRFRPYVMIGTWMMAISGFFMFWCPFRSGSSLQLVWLYIFNILYTSIALPMWRLRDQVVAVTSRNVLERNSITTIRAALGSMISGVIVALGIVGVLYPAVLQKDLTGASWMAVIGACGVIAILFSVVEYYWTRERITEDNQKIRAISEETVAIQIPLLQQLKNLLRSKYYVLSLLVMIGGLFYEYMQGGNSRVNMITYILGGNDENGLQMLYLMVAMQPIAFGAVIVPILAKKFKARSIMMVSAVITFAGVGIAMIDPFNFGIAVAGGMVFSCGIFAVTNMYYALMQQAGDMIEYDHGYRPEGTLGMGVITTLYTALMTPAGAIYETGLSLNGYVAGAATQNDAVNNWILFAYYGSYVIFAVIVFIVCTFFDAEKRMPVVQAGLRQRAQEAAAARGEVYVSPEEQERMELEAAAKELEESRIAELKVKCAKRGLDFDRENQKYLDKKEKAERKNAKTSKK